MMWRSLFRKLFGVFFLVAVLSLASFGRVFAQDSGVADGETYSTNPKNRSTQVTATVIPPNPPPYPVLIAPANNAILTSGVVVFEWEQPPGHPAALSHYELYLNGTIKFGQIHITNQETDDYVLTVTDGNKYRLALKQDKWLPDGNYTWKIRVLDVNDRGSDSTTWRFTVDSTPPNILIIEIDDKQTAISAADPTTIPSEPVVVTHTNPEIKGHTEAGSQVQLTVTFPDGSVTRYQTTADENGYFIFVIEGLQSNEVVTLTFTSIDLAGLTRVLDGLKLVYQPKKIVITLPPIFPQPVTLTIFVWQPGIPHSFESALKNLPPPFGPLITKVIEPEVPTKLIEVPIFPVEKYLGLWFLLVFGYVIAVFVVTRNRWRYFFPYLMTFMRFWFFGSRGKYRWADGGHLLPLPFYGFTLSWIDEKKKLHTDVQAASPTGIWHTPFVDGRILSVKSDHILYPFPPPIVAVKSIEDGVLLLQEGLGFKSGTPSQKTAAALLVSESDSVVALTARQQRPSWPPIVTFIPRFILALMILCAFWMIWNAKIWITIIVMLFTLWMLVRDLQVGLRKRLEVYAP